MADELKSLMGIPLCDTTARERVDDLFNTTYVVRSETGNPIAIDDGADGVPVKNLSVNLVPKQDLHGYDHPWIGGAGKNKLDWEKVTVSSAGHYGMTFTKGSSEGEVTISGTLTYSGTVAPISYADYSLSGKGYVFLTEHISGDNLVTLNRTYGLRTESEKSIAIAMNGTDGQTYSETIRISVYEAPAPTEWTPYENICPITGYDGVTVKRTGKNLVDFDKIVTAREDTDPILLREGTYYVYVASANTSFNSFVIYSVDGTGAYADVETTGSDIVTDKKMNYGTKKSKITVINPVYVKVAIATNDAIRNTNVRVMITVDTTNYESLPVNFVSGNELFESMWEPYIEPTEYSITFPSSIGTVYGGSLNVTTGELVVDKKFVDLGSLTWTLVSAITNANTWRTNGLIGQIKNADSNDVASPYILFDRYGVRSYGSSYGSTVICGYETTGGFVFVNSDSRENAPNGQLVYTLVTPITYQLTPTEVKTLLGSNTIVSDGSMDLSYRADISKVIEKLTNAIVSLGGNV